MKDLTPNISLSPRSKNMLWPSIPNPCNSNAVQKIEGGQDLVSFISTNISCVGMIKVFLRFNSLLMLKIIGMLRYSEVP